MKKSVGKNFEMNTAKKCDIIFYSLREKSHFMV